ncbi:hypothetical protein BGZ67_004082 [Mortierella alpina]|nr:hypothetical protein BGZ67_004082 [Mortierella alpina]
MRLPSLTLAISITLAFALLVSAAPAPAVLEETAEERACTEACLTTEEICLFDPRNSMGECADTYDKCHQTCRPLLEEPAPEKTPVTPPPPPAPPAVTEQPNLSNNEKHKDVTHDDPAPPTNVTIGNESEKTNEPQYEEDEEDPNDIKAPPGGEDDEEEEDDPSDY